MITTGQDALLPGPSCFFFGSITTKQSRVTHSTSRVQFVRSAKMAFVRPYLLVSGLLALTACQPRYRTYATPCPDLVVVSNRKGGLIGPKLPRLEVIHPNFHRMNANHNHVHYLENKVPNRLPALSSR